MALLTSTLKYLTKPTTITLMRGPAATSLSLFQQQSRQDLDRLRDQYLYLKQYSYLDFASPYKSWIELEHNEQERFVSRYIRLHERTVAPRHHPRSVRNALKQMERENKDIDFMFCWLYEGLRDAAVEQAKQAEAVIKDDTFDLLVKREEL